MESISDLKEMNSYRNLAFKFPIYISQSTQQIYDCNKQIKSCDSKGRVIVEELDEREQYNGFRYAQLSRARILKANNDYIKELEREAPCYRYFNENHQQIK